ISFNSTIELVSFYESQVVTLNGEFICGFKNGDYGIGSRSNNTVGSPHWFIIHWIVVRFFVRMKLSCFVDEVFDSGFVQVQEVVQQVQSWKHVYATKGVKWVILFVKAICGSDYAAFHFLEKIRRIYKEITNKVERVVNPTFSLCCQDGKVLLSKFNDTPPPLNTLLDYNDPAISKVRDQIRVYNNMFLFTSFGANVDHSINAGMRLYTFRINGQKYLRIVRNQMAAFVDKETGDKVDKRVVTSLSHKLDSNVESRTKTRQYNTPTVSKVAALITNDFGDGIPTRDIIVNKKDTGPNTKVPTGSTQFLLVVKFSLPGLMESIKRHSV
ncbi:hypothetical protein Tco_0016227, partial [Tanacetum coccineum]